MARRGRSFAKKIDNLRWIGFNGSFGALASGSTSAFTMLGATAMPDTIMRTRGQILVYVDSTQAPGVSSRVGIGMVAVPEGQSTTVIWSPLTDPNAPWFWYTSFAIGYEEMVTDVIDAPITAYRETIDSKAMRRLAADVEVQVVIESATVLGAGVALNGHVDGRCLLGA